MARPGNEPRTSELPVRCPTDCATRPGNIWRSTVVEWLERLDYLSKRHNSIEGGGGVTVLFFCTSSDEGLYLNKVS